LENIFHGRPLTNPDLSYNKWQRKELIMSTFVLTGKYSLDAMNAISAARTDEANELIKKFGGEIKSMYALLGEKDLLFIVNFPDAQNAIKASIAVSKLTGISFSTTEAITVEQFDRIVTEV
jgi:uncharacterized protein with GYD domain